MAVTVCVPTYGDSSWIALARERALPNAAAHNVPTLHVHSHSLRDARNEALDLVATSHVCFLDADDELEAGYFEAIAESDADLRVPSVRYKRNNFDHGVQMPRVAGHRHECSAECLAYGNWMVIGTVAPTALLREVGGFREFPFYEDWDIWVRCWKAGATIETCPRAVYRAHVRDDSRNRGHAVTERITVHNMIARANDLPEVA